MNIEEFAKPNHTVSTYEIGSINFNDICKQEERKKLETYAVNYNIGYLTKRRKRKDPLRGQYVLRLEYTRDKVTVYYSFKGNIPTAPIKVCNIDDSLSVLKDIIPLELLLIMANDSQKY